MNFLDKLIAGIYTIQLNGDKETLSSFNFAVARFTLVVPFGLAIVFIQVLLSETVNAEVANLLPDSRGASLAILLVLLGLSYFITSPNGQIFTFLKKTDDSELKRYNAYYRYLLYSGAALFIITVFVLK